MVPQRPGLTSHSPRRPPVSRWIARWTAQATRMNQRGGSRRGLPLVASIDPSSPRSRTSVPERYIAPSGASRTVGRRPCHLLDCLPRRIDTALPMTDVTTDAARGRYDELYQRSLSDPDAFWLKAAERLDWTRRPERALELREGSSFAWFAGGHTNLSFNALDRHVAAGRGDARALIALDERGGRRALTYAELLAEVERVAAGLRSLGIGKG